MYVYEVYYFSELLSRRHDADHLFKSGMFDHYFVRSNGCRDVLINDGVIDPSKVSVLLSAIDQGTYNHIECEKIYDVVFIGALTARRKRILTRLGKRFDIKVASAYGKDASTLYNQAKIVLNIHAEDFLDTETRIYEVLGTRSFLISEKLSEESPFISGEHLVEVSSIEEIEESLNYYLAEAEARDRIANLGYIEVSSKHTYLHRAKEVSDVMSLYVNEQNYKTPAINKRVLCHYRWFTEIPENIYSILSRASRRIRQIN